MNWHLTVMTADAQQIPFHAKLGSQTEILELASQAQRFGTDLNQVTCRRGLLLGDGVPHRGGRCASPS